MAGAIIENIILINMATNWFITLLMFTTIVYIWDFTNGVTLIIFKHLFYQNKKK